MLNPSAPGPSRKVRGLFFSPAGPPVAITIGPVTHQPGKGAGFSAEGRRDNLRHLASNPVDVLVIGGGITGAGIALQASLKGLSVGLVEAKDFASGTSSRSSKLVHGGFRYLAQGEVGLVHEALQERRRLSEMFPSLVAPISFLMPIPRSLLQGALLTAGFWTYDALSIGSHFPHHRRVSAAVAREMAPALEKSPIRGAWMYWDAQTDDALLTVEVLRRASAAGARVANYAEVTGARRSRGGWVVDVRDHAGAAIEVQASYLVNAGGIWAETIEGLTGEQPRTHLRPSKGVHLAFKLTDLPIHTALAFPVGDGRVLFAIPWKGYAIVGTTDDDYDGDIAHPGCSPEEEQDLLGGVNRYFNLDLRHEHVRSRWAGVRPLVLPSKVDGDGATKDLSRKPYIKLDERGLLTVTGGKLTTFWRMAEEAVALLPAGSGETQSMPGELPAPPPAGTGSAPLPGDAAYTMADVERALDAGMALELDDVLSRRLRLSFVDTAAAAAAAPEVAEAMAARYGWTDVGARVDAFLETLAREFGHSPVPARV